MRFSRQLAGFRIFGLWFIFVFFLSGFLSCQIKERRLSDMDPVGEGCPRGEEASVVSVDDTQWPCGSPYCPGDLVLRCGNSMASRSVRFLDKDGCFSHIGILARMDGRWVVVHAVPGEADPPGSPEYIKAESLQDFLLPDKASVWGVYRYRDVHVAEKASVVALEQYRKKLVFDHSYDLADHSRMYCSELIIYSYLSQGVDFSLEGRDLSFMPCLPSKVVFPSDIIRHKGIEKVFLSNTPGNTHWK